MDDAGNPWNVTGQWHRGSLHCHTTESDGRLTPQQTVDWYAAQGYQFVAITDHNRVTDPSGLTDHGLCLIPSTELTAQGGELGASYHLLGINLPLNATLPTTDTPGVDSVAYLREAGATAFIAHPYWSGLTVSDLLALYSATGRGDRGQGAAGIELFNGAAMLESYRGEALAAWDETLARGARWWGIATDDTHWGTIDRGLGWVVVRAATAAPDALADALARGHFYASSGPELRQVRLRPQADGSLQVQVEASPCAAIYLLGYGPDIAWAANEEAVARGELGATITEVTLTLPARPASDDATSAPRYVRVQATDWQRRSAWSNPIFWG